MNLGKSRTGADNQVSAIAVRGPSVYAGYCGSCDVVVSGQKFSSGLATNVGGHKPPKPGTHDGWHRVRRRACRSASSPTSRSIPTTAGPST